MKDNKKTEVPKSSETTDTQEKKIKDQDTNVMEIDKEFDLRERRLKLVYTILYVLAALWAALFISYGNTNDSAAPVYCGLLAAITTSILNILYFIVGEFRCLRIHKKVDDETRNEADCKFLEIWNTYGLSICMSLLLTMLNLSIQNAINNATVSVAIIIATILLYVNAMLVKNSKVKTAIRNLVTPIVCYAFFAITQLS